MGFFRRLFDRTASGSSAQNGSAPTELEPIDNSLPDDEWLACSEARYQTMVQRYYGSPETMAEGGKPCYGFGDFGTALFFFQKSIDMLHTNYLFNQMCSRSPSAADAWIVDGYTSSLGVSLAMHMAALIDDSVREVTHRLRAIATTCERAGMPSEVYRGALRQMAIEAPNVKLDDVLG